MILLDLNPIIFRYVRMELTEINLWNAGCTKKKNFEYK